MGIIIFLLIVMVTVYLVDKKRARKLRKKVSVSFLIPCYNDGNSVGDTIRSIYRSYGQDYTEVIVANDGSKDNSLKILKELRKKHHFHLVDNKKNIGKANTLNKIASLAKHEILIVVDADTLVNKKSLHDVLARFEGNHNLGGVSCPYRPSTNNNLLSLMQCIEYNMFTLVVGVYNIFSAIVLWGGFLAVRKKAFLQAGKFSVNAISEDMDLAFKLNQKKWKVEQSFFPVISDVPQTYRTWFKQKMRWTSGAAQCIFRYFNVWIKNPIHVTFMLSYTMMTVLSLYNFFSNNMLVGVWDNFSFLLKATGSFMISVYFVITLYSSTIFETLLIKSSFSLSYLVYVFPLIHKNTDIYKVFLIIPFAFVYFPIYIIISFLGMFIALYKIRTLGRTDRAW